MSDLQIKAQIELCDAAIAEERAEIEACPATPRGYRKADSHRFHLRHLIEHREKLVARLEIE